MALTRCMVDDLGVEDHPLIAGHQPRQVRQINLRPFAVVWLQTTRGGTWWAIRTRAKSGLTAPGATLMEICGSNTIEACLVTVRATGDHIAS